jgi:hypothetical protein
LLYIVQVALPVFRRSLENGMKQFFTVYIIFYKYLKPVLWIRIRIHLAVLDPDPYWESDPDPGTCKLTKILKKPDLLPFKKAVVPS